MHSKNEHENSGRNNAEVISSNPISLEKPQQKNNEGDETCGEDHEKGSNHYEKTKLVRSSKVRKRN